MMKRSRRSATPILCVLVSVGVFALVLLFVASIALSGPTVESKGARQARPFDVNLERDLAAKARSWDLQQRSQQRHDAALDAGVRRAPHFPRDEAENDVIDGEFEGRHVPHRHGQQPPAPEGAQLPPGAEVGDAGILQGDFQREALARHVGDEFPDREPPQVAVAPPPEVTKRRHRHIGDDEDLPDAEKAAERREAGNHFPDFIATPAPVDANPFAAWNRVGDQQPDNQGAVVANPEDESKDAAEGFGGLRPGAPLVVNHPFLAKALRDPEQVAQVELDHSVVKLQVPQAKQLKSDDEDLDADEEGRIANGAVRIEPVDDEELARCTMYAKHDEPKAIDRDGPPQIQSHFVGLAPRHLPVGRGVRGSRGEATLLGTNVKTPSGVKKHSVRTLVVPCLSASDWCGELQRTHRLPRRDMDSLAALDVAAHYLNRAADKTAAQEGIGHATLLAMRSGGTNGIAVGAWSNTEFARVVVAESFPVSTRLLKLAHCLNAPQNFTTDTSLEIVNVATTFRTPALGGTTPTEAADGEDGGNNDHHPQFDEAGVAVARPEADDTTKPPTAAPSKPFINCTVRARRLQSSHFGATQDHRIARTYCPHESDEDAKAVKVPRRSGEEVFQSIPGITVSELVASYYKPHPRMRRPHDVKSGGEAFVQSLKSSVVRSPLMLHFDMHRDTSVTKLVEDSLNVFNVLSAAHGKAVRPAFVGVEIYPPDAFSASSNRRIGRKLNRLRLHSREKLRRRVAALLADKNVSAAPETVQTPVADPFDEESNLGFVDLLVGHGYKGYAHNSQAFFLAASSQLQFHDDAQNFLEWRDVNVNLNFKPQDTSEMLAFTEADQPQTLLFDGRAECAWDPHAIARESGVPGVPSSENAGPVDLPALQVVPVRATGADATAEEDGTKFVLAAPAAGDAATELLQVEGSRATSIATMSEDVLHALQSLNDYIANEGEGDPALGAKHAVRSRFIDIGGTLAYDAVSAALHPRMVVNAFQPTERAAYLARASMCFNNIAAASDFKDAGDDGLTDHRVTVAQGVFAREAGRDCIVRNSQEHASNTQQLCGEISKFQGSSSVMWRGESLSIDSVLGSSAWDDDDVEHEVPAANAPLEHLVLAITAGNIPGTLRGASKLLNNPLRAPRVIVTRLKRRAAFVETSEMLMALGYVAYAPAHATILRDVEQAALYLNYTSAPSERETIWVKPRDLDLLAATPATEQCFSPSAAVPLINVIPVKHEGGRIASVACAVADDDDDVNDPRVTATRCPAVRLAAQDPHRATAGLELRQGNQSTARRMPAIELTTSALVEAAIERADNLKAAGKLSLSLVHVGATSGVELLRVTRADTTAASVGQAIVLAGSTTEEDTVAATVLRTSACINGFSRKYATEVNAVGAAKTKRWVNLPIEANTIDGVTKRVMSFKADSAVSRAEKKFMIVVNGPTTPARRAYQYLTGGVKTMNDEERRPVIVVTVCDLVSDDAERVVELMFGDEYSAFDLQRGMRFATAADALGAIRGLRALTDTIVLAWYDARAEQGHAYLPAWAPPLCATPVPSILDSFTLHRSRVPSLDRGLWDKEFLAHGNHHLAELHAPYTMACPTSDHKATCDDADSNSSRMVQMAVEMTIERAGFTPWVGVTPVVVNASQLKPNTPVLNRALRQRVLFVDVMPRDIGGQALEARASHGVTSVVIDAHPIRRAALKVATCLITPQIAADAPTRLHVMPAVVGAEDHPGEEETCIAVPDRTSSRKDFKVSCAANSASNAISANAENLQAADPMLKAFKRTLDRAVRRAKTLSAVPVAPVPVGAGSAKDYGVAANAPRPSILRLPLLSTTEGMLQGAQSWLQGTIPGVEKPALVMLTRVHCTDPQRLVDAAKALLGAGYMALADTRTNPKVLLSVRHFESFCSSSSGSMGERPKREHRGQQPMRPPTLFFVQPADVTYLLPAHFDLAALQSVKHVCRKLCPGGSTIAPRRQAADYVQGLNVLCNCKPSEFTPAPTTATATSAPPPRQETVAIAPKKEEKEDEVVVVAVVDSTAAAVEEKKKLASEDEGGDSNKEEKKQQPDSTQGEVAAQEQQQPSSVAPPPPLTTSSRQPQPEEA